MQSETYHSSSNITKSDIKTEKSIVSSTLRKDVLTGGITPSFHMKNKNNCKIITLCLKK